MYPGIELRLLRYVVVLAKELNFTRAAARLHVAQPSLSRQIRDVEDYLGVRLFERTKREVGLTAAGEAFAAEARQAIYHAERAVEAAHAAKGQHRGAWCIAYSPLVDRRALSKVKRHLALSHPTAEIRFSSAFTSEQADGLIRGRLHAGLVILPLREKGLTCERFYRESLVLGLSETHLLAARPVIDISDLHERPLVTVRADIEPRFGEDLNRIFGVARIRPRIVHEATTQAEALELVSESGVAALVMPSAQYPARQGVVFRKFADDFLAAETGLAYLQQDRSDILASLRTFLRETFQPLAASSDRPNDGLRQMSLF